MTAHQESADWKDSLESGFLAEVVSLSRHDKTISAHDQAYFRHKSDNQVPKSDLENESQKQAHVKLISHIDNQPDSKF